MMRLGMTVCLLASLCETASARSLFECSDVQGSLYNMEVGKTERVLEVTEKGVTTKYPLAAANIGRPSLTAGVPLLFNGWKKEEKKWWRKFDFSTEVYLHYTVNTSASVAVLGITVDNRERSGLTCKVMPHQVVIQTIDKTASFIDRMVKLLKEGATSRELSGSLSEIGVMQVRAAVERFVRSDVYNNVQQRSAFVDQVASPVKNISPDSVKEVASSLSPDGRRFWDPFLENIQYKYYPETARCISWVSEALSTPKRDYMAVVGAFQRFRRSPVYRQADMLKIFTTDVRKPMSVLAEGEVTELMKRMDVETSQFFKQVWDRSVGKKSLADFPDLGDNIREIASYSAVDDEKFDLDGAQEAILGFFRSPLAADPEVRALYVEALMPELRRLSPRKKEDIAAWLDGTDKALFLSLSQ